MRKLTRILVSGEGGQGVQIIAKALSISAYRSGMESLYVPNYGVEQRGGVSLGFVQISNQEIGFPKFHFADVLVVLRERAIKRIEEYLKKETVIIYDGGLVSHQKMSHIPNQKININASETAKDIMVPKVFNMIILGAVCKHVGIEENVAAGVVTELLAEKYEKNPQLKHFNERAIQIGFREMEKDEVLV